MKLRLRIVNGPGRFAVRDETGLVYEVDGATERDYAMARGIVRAANNHAALVDSLRLATLLMGCGDPLDDFEALADLFYQETNYMRPGKSDVREFHSYEERERAFKEWVARKKGDIAATLAAAKGGSE